MKRLALTFSITALACCPLAVQAQIPEFNVAGRPVDIHAFASQGFAYSDQNNFLTMKTSNGSAAMTDFAVNGSIRITDNLRVGAQMYDYNVGHLGNWQPTLDWGFVDYKFKDWFGIRAGKVKTALGLYNDTQDAAFLYTWALMPQSIYPLDLRSASIAHVGGDVYGHFGLKRAGSVDYTAYVGRVPFDKHGGNYYSTISAGTPESNYKQLAGGGDIRWNTPVSGLMLGNSFTVSNLSGQATENIPFIGSIPVTFSANGVRIIATYADYALAKWHFTGEFRNTHEIIQTVGISSDFGDNAFFAGVAYRLQKHLGLGTYTSRLYLNQSMTPSNTDTNHIFDQAVTARVDLTRFWNVKVEGHFMKGYGDLYSARGFYPVNNPTGLKPDTNLLIVRTGFNF